MAVMAVMAVMASSAEGSEYSTAVFVVLFNKETIETRGGE